jgi:hypothetical protein
MTRRFTGCSAVVVLSVALLRALCGNSAADDESDVAGSASWHWTPDEWTYTETNHNAGGYADRPGEGTLNAITAAWRRPELDALGNFCTVRGRLSVADYDNGKERPVDWLQGITVYMGIAPEAKPDWSEGMNQRDTVFKKGIVQQSGEFKLRIDLRKTKQDRARAQLFQFGVALAIHTATGGTRQTIVWNSRSPAIPAASSMLTVPAAPELSRELDLINRTSGWPFSNPDGTDLIRAVNSLQRLGKDKALAVLEKYLELVSQADYRDEQDIVFWIVRLLFEPIQPNKPLRPPAIAVLLDDREVAEVDKWPLNPIGVIDDMPFMLGRRINMAGMPQSPKTYVKWARHSGVVRERRLMPAKDPIVAAETLFGDQRFLALDDFARNAADRIVRLQATAMAGLTARAASGRLSSIDDLSWEASVTAAARRIMSWDADRERFTIERR